MKKIFTKLISTSLIVFVVAVAPCVSTANESIEELTPKVDALFEELNTNDSPGAAIAIVQDGQIIYQAGYGNANLEYNIPITPKTIFNVSSVSKQFTAYAITLLNDQKLLTLDDDVRKHIPELPDYGKTITLRHLLHHTSGLRSQNTLLSMAGWRLDDVITKDHIFNLVLRQKNLNFNPGEEHLYSNTGYTLLAEIVARVSGMSFSNWTEINIFKPLDMTNSHFRNDHLTIVKNRAYSYSATEMGYQKSVLNYAYVGATSLFTTVGDLSKWVINFSEHQIGSTKIMNQMLLQGVLNNGEQIAYAQGLHISNYRGLKAVSHSGNDAGFNSQITHFPEKNFTAIILSNLKSVRPGRLSLQIADLFLSDAMSGKPIEKNNKNDGNNLTQSIGNFFGSIFNSKKLKPSKMTQFVGDYFSEELQTTYSLVIEDKKLVAKHLRNTSIPLIYKGKDVFSGDSWYFTDLEFERDGDIVTGFLLSAKRARNIRFEKIEIQ